MSYTIVIKKFGETLETGISYNNKKLVQELQFPKLYKLENKKDIVKHCDEMVMYSYDNEKELLAMQEKERGGLVALRNTLEKILLFCDDNEEEKKVKIKVY